MLPRSGRMRVAFNKNRGCGNMVQKGETKSIPKMLEAAASEMCEKYCKFPDQYIENNEELTDLMTEKLVAEHCEHCPMTQFFL